jgi:peptide/nickel transport system substrate-binding protein
VQGSNPPSLDAMATSSQASRNVNMNVYETLYGFSERIVPIPILAEGVRVSPDGMTYVFTMRRGVRFHNGKEMTARDVKASLERYRKVRATGGLMSLVRQIDITGDYEVPLGMVAPTPTFLESFSSPRAPGRDHSRGGRQRRGRQDLQHRHRPLSHRGIRARQPRDAGALRRLCRRHPPAGIDGFGGRKTAWLDRVIFRVMPEPGAQVAPEAGEIHLLEQIPVPAARRLVSNKAIVMHENMPWAMTNFILNMIVPPTDNPKFRQAVQVALNMEEIMAISSEGLFKLNHGWQYPGTTYDAGPIGKQWYNLADVNRARAMLKEAGYAGQEFVLLTDSNITQHNKAAVVIAENLKAAGINVKINQVDWPTALSIRMKDTGWHGWTLQMGIEPYLGPVAVVGTLASPARPHFVKPDAALDALYTELIGGATVEARQATFGKIQARLYDLHGIVKVGDAGLT